MPKNEDEKLLYSLTYRDVVDILRVVKDSEYCDSLQLEFGEMKLGITRSGVGEPAAPGKSTRIAPASAEPETGAVDAGYASVVAPMLGTFFVAPTPNAPPFVQPGDVVATGDTLGLIEVMKLFTPITAGVAGKLVRVLAENGALVEHGQRLFLIDPLA